MRFAITLLLDDEVIDKDKNRIILHILKTIFNKTDSQLFEKLYKENIGERKNFTFATYLGKDAAFGRDKIVIPNKKIILNISTSDLELGILLYNSFILNQNKRIPIKNNKIKIEKIELKKDITIRDRKILVKTLSPICVREHRGDNSSTWFHSLEDERGMRIFIENLTYQLIEEFGENRIRDIEDLEVRLIKNKTVKVKHYDIVILSNISFLEIKAEEDILDYLYKAGVGSLKSSGFGMLDLL